MELVLKSIGLITSDQVEPYQAARQPDGLSLPATLMLQGDNFLQALQDLDGCSHVWIIFGFHHNTSWKPLVQTPRSDRKIGVFATRAPYRPNPLGLTCVPLLKISGTTLFLGPNDLLDGTPVYDIKPYISEVDSVPEATVKWLKTSVHPKMKVSFSPSAEEELGFLEINKVTEIRPFIMRQLEYDAINTQKKRIEKNNHFWTLSYRTWRVDFILADSTKDSGIKSAIGVVAIRSGYSTEDLLNPEDTYQDKAVHIKFIKHFNLK